MAPPHSTDGPSELDEALIKYLLGMLVVPADKRLCSLGEIGRGGAGAISIISDPVLQRTTAKKTLLDAARARPLLVRAFIREAQITGQLDHPNIVPVHDMGIDAEGRPYFTMKLIEGRTLADRIAEYADDHRHVDQAYDQLLDLLEILVKVCDAVAFAHSRGVIHCDLKAQNILVGNFGQVYLTDWGGAQLLKAKAGPEDSRRVQDLLPQLPLQSTAGFMFGTPGYMSPEHARGELDRMDERSDVFSLGALLYHILSGHPPFRAETPAHTVLLAQSCNFPSLQEQSAGPSTLRPRELVRIVMKAMARLPEERYQRVELLQADLVHFLRGGNNLPSHGVEAGTHIIREGEGADAAYIIRSGKCEVYTMMDGQRVSLKVLTEGDVFGETALLTSSPRMASVVALTDVVLVVVTGAEVERELNSMKPWMGAFVRALASRFRDQQESRVQQPAADRAPPPQVDPAPRGDDAATTDSARPWWRLW